MDPKKLRKQYMQCIPDINKVLEHVKTQLADLPPSEFQLETNVKPYSSVKRKMEINRIKDPKELSDLVRGRLFFSDQFNYPDVTDILSKLFGEQVKGISGDADHGKEYGLEHRGVMHVDIDIDGTRFELQVMPIEFQPHKEFLHQIYDKFRTPKIFDKMTDQQKDFLRKIHNKSYKKLDEEAKKARSD